jgi:acylphosphatase
VQGVNFRAWAAERAQAHGVSGWIRNSDDGGSVAGQAVGAHDKVASLCVSRRWPRSTRLMMW